jgi:hypothetical protein
VRRVLLQKMFNLLKLRTHSCAHTSLNKIVWYISVDRDHPEGVLYTIVLCAYNWCYLLLMLPVIWYMMFNIVHDYDGTPHLSWQNMKKILILDSAKYRLIGYMAFCFAVFILWSCCVCVRACHSSGGSLVREMVASSECVCVLEVVCSQFALTVNSHFLGLAIIHITCNSGSWVQVRFQNWRHHLKGTATGGVPKQV